MDKLKFILSTMIVNYDRFLPYHILVTVRHTATSCQLIQKITICNVRYEEAKISMNTGATEGKCFFTLSENLRCTLLVR